MDLISKTEQEKSVNKQREYYISKSNDFIQLVRNTHDLRELRLLLTLISKIKPEDAPDTEYLISVMEFGRLCGCEQNYTVIKKIITRLGMPFWMKNLYGNGDDYMLFWFRHAIYNDKRGSIRFVFNETVRPFLFELKNRFTRYPLLYILPMRSGYSVKLYELLKCVIEETPQQPSRKYDLERLKELLGATTYKTWHDFKRRVLEPALGELNSREMLGEVNIYSDIKVIYRTEKESKKIKNIAFHVMKKSPDELEIIKQKDQWILDGELLRDSEVKHYIPGQMCMEDYFGDDVIFLGENKE